jgi:AcrR family transcriptional regulator
MTDHGTMSKQTAGDRLAEAAFALFDERGYEQTTVDDITERAGLGRATFFRHYRSKEDVIFPDHDRLLGQIKERLKTSNQRTALAAVSDAVRLVLLHYLDEGDLARRRYAITSTEPALRDREIASVARYQYCAAGSAVRAATRSPRLTMPCARSSASSPSQSFARTPAAPPSSRSAVARTSTCCSPISGVSSRTGRTDPDAGRAGRAGPYMP